MSESSKAWKVFGPDNDPEDTSIVFADTAGQAKAWADNWGGFEFTQLRAHRLPWLDGIEPWSFEGVTVLLNHGWTVDTGNCHFEPESMTPEKWELLRKEYSHGDE